MEASCGSMGDTVQIMSSKGLFITIEGVHGCGKSTIGARLCETLRTIGRKPILVIDQQGTVLGKELRKVNLELRGYPISPISEALMIAAARHQNIVEVIKPNLKKGNIVISERFNDAFFAFQVFGRGLSKKFVEFLSQAVAEGTDPDLTILLDVAPSISLNRIRGAGMNRIEREPLYFHNLVRAGYLERAKQFPERIAVYNASLVVEKIFQQIWKRVFSLLSEERN